MTPGRTRTWRWRGSTTATGDAPSKDIDRAIKLDDEFEEAYNARGYAYYTAGNYDQALRDYNRAIKLNADFALCYLNRAIVYNDLEAYDRAIEDLDAAIKIDPDYFAAYNNRGHVRLQQGEYGDALKDSDRAIKLDPDKAVAHFNRGLASYYLEKVRAGGQGFQACDRAEAGRSGSLHQPGARLPEARPARAGAAGLCDGKADQVVRPGPALKRRHVMLTAHLTRIGRFLVCSLAFAAIGNPVLANNDWRFDSGEVGSNKVCSMLHEAGGHILLVLFMRFPEKPDAGIVTFSFKDEALIEAAKAHHPVQLEFDTATVEGYRLEYTASGFISIHMTTDALTDLFEKFDKANHLDVVTSTARVPFKLGGFADALEQLRSCAQPA